MSLPKNEFRKKIDFISGAGILFNKNTINLILKNKDEFDKNEIHNKLALLLGHLCNL